LVVQAANGSAAINKVVANLALRFMLLTPDLKQH
jgi:hypothetical protein